MKEIKVTISVEENTELDDLLYNLIIKVEGKEEPVIVALNDDEFITLSRNFGISIS